MSEAEDDIAAALLALGGCDAKEFVRLQERTKHDHAFGAKVAAWEMLLAPLADFAPDRTPSDSLLQRIDARLDCRQHLDALSRTLRVSEGNWIKVSLGLRIQLMNDPGRRTVLLDVEPGATYPAHDHTGDEGIYMISGDLIIGDVELGPGDYHFSPKGSRHSAATSRAGCRCIVSTAAG